MNPRNPKSLLALLCVIAICLLLGASARWGQDLRQQRLDGLFPAIAITESSDEQGEDIAAWFSIDGDGLYHTRRVSRLFEEGFPVAATDERLNHPDGAAIPWPPFYENVCYALLSPFAPSDPAARSQYLEQAVAMLPFYFGLLSIVLLIWVVLKMPTNAESKNASQLPAALLAGLLLALNYGAAHYSAPGIGDHHAWVALLTLGMWALIAVGMREDVLEQPRRAAKYGVMAGAVGGVLLGSWVAALIYVLLVQLAFGVLLIAQRKKPRAGLAALGLGFHLTALLILTPAILASPWKIDFPWMVVNLSWFHFWHLILGAVVFAPLLRQPNGGRVHPLAIPGAIIAVLSVCVLAQIGPGAGIREGMAWVSRADEFMSGIAESESLMGEHGSDALSWIGIILIALPFAWLSMLRNAWRSKNHTYSIWLIAIPLLTLQALTQRRFADALAAPMALCVAWAVFEWLQSKRNQALIALPVALIVGVGLNALSLNALTSPLGRVSEADAVQNAYREIYEWIGQQPLLDAQESVLAPWDQGHAIEWLSNRGSVATNFGTYVGEDSYRDPARFFLSNDAAAAEQILQRRKTRYVVRTSQMTLSLDPLVKALQSDEIFVESFTNKRGQKRDRLTSRWYQSLAAILWIPNPPADPNNPVFGTGNGDPDGPTRPGSPISFLRLVRLSPVPDTDPRHGGLMQPAAQVWEYVPGATLSAKLKPSQTLSIRFAVTTLFNGQSLLSFQYTDSAKASTDGVASIRVPYSTDPTGNGGSVYVGEARYFILNPDGSQVSSGEFMIMEGDVLQGNTVFLKSDSN